MFSGGMSDPPLRPPKVSLLIRRELFERAKDFNIILDDVAITELSFSREYTAAVEAKQVGEWREAAATRRKMYFKMGLTSASCTFYKVDRRG